MYGLALEHCRNGKHIRKRGVCARADAHLVDLHTTELVNALYVVGAVRASREGLEGGEIDGVFRIIYCVSVGCEGSVISLSVLSLKECEGSLV